MALVMVENLTACPGVWIILIQCNLECCLLLNALELLERKLLSCHRHFRLLIDSLFKYKLRRIPVFLNESLFSPVTITAF